MTADQRSARLKEMLNKVEQLAGGDLGVRLSISDKRDEIDALSFGINILADEIQYHLADAKRRAEELAAAQEQLIQTAKMAALGEFSAGLAHEINNPLTLIRASLDQISSMAEKKTSLTKSELQQPIERINSAIDRTTKIIKHVRDFSKPQTTFTHVSLNDVVASALEFVNAQLTSRSLAVDLDLSHRAPVVNGNQPQLEQVVLNLVSNSADAIEAKGSASGFITIRTFADGAGSVLVVEDDGIGIPESDFDKVYLPFFTTKEPAKGTGIGLSISHRILTAHGATIHCESKTSVGTKFRIWFPPLT